jgi:MFS family permease
MSTRAMGPLAGISWLKNGINLGRNNAKAIFGAAALLLVAMLLPSVITVPIQLSMTPGLTSFTLVIVVSVLLGLLLAPLIGGFFAVIDAAENGRPAKATDVFAFYRRGEFGRMVGFALGMFVLYAIAMGLVVAVMGTGIVHWYTEVLAAQAAHHPEAIPHVPAGFAAAVALGSVLWLLISGIYAIALGQVALTRRPLLDALRDGLMGSLKNLLPLLVMVIVGILGMVACMLVFALLVALLMFLGKLVGVWLMIVVLVPLYIGLILAVYAVMFGVMYSMWRDVCADDRLAEVPLAGVAA